MKTLIAIASSFALVFSTSAETFKLPKTEPIASITFPDTWKVTGVEESFDAESADQEIYLYAEIIDADSIDAAITEAVAYLDKEKVLVKKGTQTEHKDEVNGIPVVDVTFEGKDKDGLCKVSLTFFVISKTKILSTIYWASLDGEKKHVDELKAIYHSIKRTEN